MWTWRQKELEVIMGRQEYIEGSARTNNADAKALSDLPIDFNIERKADMIRLR